MSTAWRVSLRAPRGRDKNYSLRIFDPSGKEVRTRTCKTADPLEAERLRAQVEADFNTQATLADQPTYGAVWEAYAAHRTSEGCGESTKAWIHASRKALSALEHVKVGEIDGPTLERTQSAMFGHYALRTIRNYMSCARLCWGWAKRHGHVKVKWEDLPAPVAVECKRTTKRPFLPAEVQQIFTGAVDFAGGKHYSLLRVLHDTGCRVSEACGILERDVDRGTGAVTFTKTKTGKPRTVHLDPEVLASIPSGAPDDHLFKGARGGRVSRFSVHTAFKRICEIAGVAGAVDVHSFRRTWVQDATQTPGLPLAVAQGVTGHSSLSVFLGYQANTLTRETQAASEAVRARRASQKTPRILGGSDPAALAAAGVMCPSPSRRNGEKQGVNHSPANGLSEPVSQGFPAIPGHPADALREIVNLSTKYREALRALCLDPAARAAFLEMLK